MKNLTVVIRAELEVPDDWMLAEHASGMHVLKVGDQFIDFELAPLATTKDHPDAEWSDRDFELAEQVMDAIVGIDVELEMTRSQ